MSCALNPLQLFYMANWLDSTDAVILFTGNAVLDCNEAALRLFAYSDKYQVLAQSPASFMLGQQPDSLNAEERLMMLFSLARQEGFSKGAVVGRKADNRGFYANLIVVAESGAPGSYDKVYCTKWLPMRSFDLGQILPEEQFLQEPAFNNSTGLLQIGAEGEILQVNEVLAEWLGYKPQDLCERYLLQDILQDPSPEYLLRQQTDEVVVQDINSLLLKTRDKKTLSLKATHKWINGAGILRILLKQAPVQLQDAKFMSLELERLKQENRNLKRVQRVLRKSMERLRVLAEYSPDVIMQFDREHRHLFVNKQVENQLPVKVEDFLGRTHQQMEFPEEFSTICEQALDKVFSTGERHRLDLQLPNGAWVDWFLIPQFNTSGEVITVTTTARDITDQKRTAAELEKSQQKIHDAFEVTKLSSWEYVVAKGELLLNEQLRDLLGITDQRKFIDGLTFVQEFLLPEEQGKLRYLVRTAAENKDADFKEVIDYRLRRLDGNIIHVLGSIRLELGAEGEVIRAFGTAQDITQLRLTEQELEEYRAGLEQLVETRTHELKKSEEKLADALRLANLGTWEFDPVTDCFIVSDNVLEIFGTTREIEGGNMVSVSRVKESIYPEDRKKYRKTVERVSASDDDFYTDSLEMRIRRSDGEIRHLYVSIKISKTKNFIKFYGTLQDISTIRNTELEKDRLTAIIETTSDIVGIAGVDGHIQYLNKAGKEFFGIWSEETLQQKTFQNFHANNITRVLSRKELRHADKWGTWSGQNRYLSYDGREVYVSQVIISHKNAEGQVQCYSTILRDMSEQKKIEQDLIFKNNELDTFIYRASHDLRGPIATLLGLNQIVKYEVQDSSALRFFDLYNSQVMRLHNITVSLIELTKIKDRSCEVSEIDFKGLWQQVKDQLRNLPESAEVTLEDVIEDVKGFNSDAHLLEVIIYNLVENSIRYRKSEVKSFAKLEVIASTDSDRVTIKVSDNGIGIASDLQHKIYNMFFRGTERSKGPGLGLYILKNAVEKLGGRTTLYSVPYKGTTFKIELPSLSGAV